MESRIVDEIQVLNPWLKDQSKSVFHMDDYIHREQAQRLLSPAWDSLVTVLVGPRQAGKTTLGFYLCQQVLKEQRFNQLVYLNCDSPLLRQWLTGVTIISELKEEFQLESFILFIDEVQRLESPGLFLKSLVDLKLPIKIIVSGSSQLEMRSQVQEHLTGRQIEAIILPLSQKEIGSHLALSSQLIDGCYPQIVESDERKLLLSQLYQNYINKDIIEILQIGKPLAMERLLTLIAHSSGQLVNYESLSNDCGVSTAMIKSFLDVLVQTYVIKKIVPFVGNKRTEITSNPVLYFIDNGFRNQALGNFSGIDNRTDAGLLVEGKVFQEIYKYKTQNFLDFTIYYWRTKSGAEVDFIIYKNSDQIIPVEVKYRNMSKATISRGFRSFIDAYSPDSAVIVTKDFEGFLSVHKTKVSFIPLRKFGNVLNLISGMF